MDRTSDKQWLHDISHVGMRMGQSCQREQRNQAARRKLFSEFPLTPREALYGGRCETFSLHASCTDTSVIQYVDVQSLYPYVCKNKHYPIGHPRCLIGPDLRKFGMDVNKFEGLVKCKVLPPRGLHIPLLPSHIYIKLMFVLCRKGAETENQSICNLQLAIDLSQALGYLLNCKKQCRLDILC